MTRCTLFTFVRCNTSCTHFLSTSITSGKQSLCPRRFPLPRSVCFGVVSCQFRAAAYLADFLCPTKAVVRTWETSHNYEDNTDSYTKVMSSPTELTQPVDLRHWLFSTNLDNAAVFFVLAFVPRGLCYCFLVFLSVVPLWPCRRSTRFVVTGGDAGIDGDILTLGTINVTEFVVDGRVFASPCTFFHLHFAETQLHFCHELAALSAVHCAGCHCTISCFFVLCCHAFASVISC